MPSIFRPSFMLAAAVVASESSSLAAQLAARPLLTVRPHEMATGTQTKTEGAQIIDSVKQTWVYVPQQCVGAHRCPLVVVLGGAAISSMEMVNFMRPLSFRASYADRHGMILLAPEAAAYPGVWDVISGTNDQSTEGRWTPLGLEVSRFRDNDVRNIDAAMKQVLAQFAIDPDKIAVEGFSNGGSYALFLGRNNPQVFSRIAAVSPVFPTVVDDPPKQNTQILISGGMAEGAPIMQVWFGIAEKLRKDGHVVDLVPGLRDHMDFEVDKDYEWQWLADSWGLPREPDAPITRATADSDVVLTADVLAKMTAFWTRFMKEPDSIHAVGRQVHEPLALVVGPQSVTVVATKMTKLAARYPSVAADLQAAGLTAREADRYRASMIRAELAHMVYPSAGVIAKTSVLGQNLAFRRTHRQAFEALGETQMWTTP